ncbi:MAG TPA: HdeD family acid-resistance protein, partial [Bryobacteraceae bacterium]|nr:HdeD family acid-resistance protein [Bryobacteraceae bacterium]
MTFVLARNWWSLVLRGIFAVLFAVITFVWPAITLAALVLLFGAYAVVDGVISLIGAVRSAAAHERWGALLFEGIAGTVAGLLTLIWPAITAFALTMIIGAWAIVTGVAEILAAFRIRKYVAGEILLLLTGVASIVFGLLAWFMPLAGALAIAMLIGAYAFVFGVLLI